jgi:hypothetical protein
MSGNYAAMRVRRAIFTLLGASPAFRSAPRSQVVSDSCVEFLSSLVRLNVIERRKSRRKDVSERPRAWYRRFTGRH